MAFLEGGRVGDYDLIVVRNNYGSSYEVANTNDDFTYEITISSVSNNSGSQAGGTLITITGTNFVDGDT